MAEGLNSVNSCQRIAKSFKNKAHRESSMTQI